MTNLELMDSIIKFRKEDNTFQRSIDERSEKMSFRFFDGPPFASGTPHYGHLLAGSIKDIVARYMTMRGYQVKRKRGRDCHGLPVEKAVEKALWIDGKRDIETKIWIESFVEKCRAYVNDTNDVRKRFIDHTARRADVENEYRTMDLDFMESVMYCFDKIYKDNLVYKGFKVQRYCPSCATPLANNEVGEGYEDKTDTAITVKFQLNAKKTHENLHSELWDTVEYTPEGCLKCVRAIIKNEKGEILQMFNKKLHLFTVPWGKIDKGETSEQAIEREIKEEIWTPILEKVKIGTYKYLFKWWCIEADFYEVRVDTTAITNPEPDTHEEPKRVKVEPSQANSFGFQLVMENAIITDEEEIQHQFKDLYTYLQQIPQKIAADTPQQPSEIFLLARTTTPRTLPSNMFLAVGENIEYSMVYDFASKEYYILATNLLKKYYKNPEDYLTIRTLKGKELQGLYYKPLFDYITTPFSKGGSTEGAGDFAKREKYLNQFFQILNADFVSTEDGTGIVHIAPTFGEEDFQVVAKLLWAQNALERLFMPVNEYGEFDEQIYDYTWQSVLNINTTIINRLKEERKLIKSESITHSYPHCRRCHTPLISKAMSSRFIKEQQMNAETRKAAEHINFVPESVKNRFVNGLQQAPDRNIARNRYRGSPLPIWQNVDDENDRFSVGSLEEIYQLSRTGSKNITKHLFIRHGRTDYNELRKHDSLWNQASLNEEGKQHAEQIKEYLQTIKDKKNIIIVLSPLNRSWQTIHPFLTTKYTSKQLQQIQTNYEKVQEKYREIRNTYRIIQYLGDNSKEQLFEIWENIFVDFRITEILHQYRQNEKREYINPDKTIPNETITSVVNRTDWYIKEISKKFPTETIITVSHGSPIIACRYACRKFKFEWCDNTSDYRQFKNTGYSLSNKGADFAIHYRDNTREKEIDLHKPYVDTYRFVKDGKTYKRVPEVMDCRFESGAMPFGQEHYIGE